MSPLFPKTKETNVHQTVQLFIIFTAHTHDHDVARYHYINTVNSTLRVLHDLSIRIYFLYRSFFLSQTLNSPQHIPRKPDTRYTGDNSHVAHVVF